MIYIAKKDYKLMNILGNIKILDDKIIIETNNKIEIWIKTNKISKDYIIYNNNYYYKLDEDIDYYDEEPENDF